MWVARILRNQLSSVLSRFWAAAAHLRFLLILLMHVLRPSQCPWAGGEFSLSKCSSSNLWNLWKQLAVDRQGRLCPRIHRDRGVRGGLRATHSHAAACFWGFWNSISAEFYECLWKARLAPPPHRVESLMVTRTGEYMLTILLGEYLPGVSPFCCKSHEIRKHPSQRWLARARSVTSGGVRIVLRDRSFSIQPAGAAAPVLT